MSDTAGKVFVSVEAGFREVASGDGGDGVPVRAGSFPGAGAGAAIARGGVSVRLELGPGQVRGTVRGGAEVVLGRRAAQAVEHGEEGRPGAGLVGRELQVRLPGSVP